MTRHGTKIDIQVEHKQEPMPTENVVVAITISGTPAGYEIAVSVDAGWTDRLAEDKQLRQGMVDALEAVLNRYAPPAGGKVN